MSIMLPSNKSIRLDGVLKISPIQLFEYPDVYTSMWYEFDVTYKNGEKITYSYHTRSQAETDRNIILKIIDSI